MRKCTSSALYKTRLSLGIQICISESLGSTPKTKTAKKINHIQKKKKEKPVSSDRLSLEGDGELPNNHKQSCAFSSDEVSPFRRKVKVGEINLHIQVYLRDLTGFFQTTVINSDYHNKASHMSFLVSQCISKSCLHYTIVYEVCNNIMFFNMYILKLGLPQWFRW